jgi:CubicO group peptidase (beta-lactamase class C family)
MARTADFDAVLSAVVDPDGPGAVVAVLEDGAFVHRRAYGLADLEWGTPLSPDCSFRIASLTKQFTAAAVMRLEEQRRLGVDDRLEVHLPDWEPRGRAVTIRHLLNHTSGIRDHDEGQGPRTTRPDLARAEVLKQVFSAPFVSEPGERYRYCNSGYLLLGAVIEAASGQAYAAFLADAFFQPFGMTRTRLWDPDDLTPLRAHGYVRGRSGYRNARQDPLNWSHSAGNLLSTVDDLAIWDRALRRGEVIAPATFARMTAPTLLADGGVYPYGFGWGTATYGGRNLHHHTGGISGFASHLTRLDDGSLTVIVLSNLYAFPFDRVTRGLLRVALDLSPIMPTAASAASVDVRPLIGDYVGAENGRFPIGPGGADPSAFASLGDGRFCDPKDPEVEFRFSDLVDDAYHEFEYVSPLWPATKYVRARG